MGWSGGGSVNIDDATLIKNTQGQIEVNLANANTWTATQTFGNGYQVKVANYSASGSISTNTNYITANASSGAITLTLPSATGSGRQYTIIKSDNTTNAITIQPSGSDTIDGINSRVLTDQYEKTSLVDITQGLWTDLSFKWTGIQGYVPITITNSQSTATGSNFQAYVSVNLSSFSGFINPNLTNLYFSSDVEGTQVLNSWRESGTSNTGTVTYWVLLPDGIAANTSITIYLQVDNITNNDLNVTTTGVNPTLTSTYAQYDNGANVFSYYQPWGNLSALPSGWSEDSGTQITYTSTYTEVKSAASSSGGYGIFVSTSAFPTTCAWDFYGNMYNSVNAGQYVGSVTSGAAYGFKEGVSSPYNEIYFENGSTNTAISYDDTNTTKVYTMYQNGTSAQMFVNYTSIFSTTSATSESPTYFYIAPSNNSGTPATGITIYWLRSRAYPPNGTMPSVSVGSLTIT
jgi:hypothetical protein